MYREKMTEVEHKYVLGDDGIRRERRGRYTYKKCIGEDNTCISDGKAVNDGLCNGCLSGYKKKDYKGMVEGEIRVVGGRRRKKVGDQIKKLCLGDDDTCTHISDNEFCVGHINGTVKQSIAKYSEGDVFERDGKKFKIYVSDGKKCAKEVKGTKYNPIRIDENGVKWKKTKKGIEKRACKEEGCTSFIKKAQRCTKCNEKLDTR